MAVDDHAMPAPDDAAPARPAPPTPPAAAAEDTASAAAAEAAAAEGASSSPNTVRSAGNNDNNDDNDDDNNDNNDNNNKTASASVGEAAASTAADEAPDADPNEPPPAKRRALCDICHGAPAKYKCPRCPQAYCSVVCARTHRDNHPPEPAPDPTAAASDRVPPPPPSSSAGAPAADRHPFGVLDDAPELRRLFEQYPGLPARLRAIYEATQPPPPAAAADGGGSGGWRGGGRGRGGGGGGGFRGGGRGGPRAGDASSFAAPYRPAQQPWTKEQGLRQGQQALRRARVDPGDDGDGVRAYCELVLHLLARAPPAAGAAAEAAAEIPHGASGGDGSSADATALVRQEVARADAQLVEQLLQADTAAGGLR